MDRKLANHFADTVLRCAVADDGNIGACPADVELIAACEPCPRNAGGANNTGCRAGEEHLGALGFTEFAVITPPFDLVSMGSAGTPALSSASCASGNGLPGVGRSRRRPL